MLIDYFKQNLDIVKFIILILIISSVSSSFVNAAFDFNLYVNNNYQSIDLTYGDSKSVPVKVVSNNQWCDITCKVKAHDTIQDLGILRAGYSKEVNFLISTSSKGREGESTSYAVVATCDQVSSFTCSYIQGNPKDTILTLTYHLTVAQKEARDYVNLNLPSLTDLLAKSDSSIKKLEDKLAQLTKNVKVSNIPAELSNLKEKYSSYKNEINKIKSLMEDAVPEYVQAKSLFRSSLISDVQNLITNGESSNQELAKIIERHNAIANKIELLNKLNLQIKDKLRFVNEENTVTSDMAQVTVDFNSGNFQDYDSIEKKIDNLDSLGKSFLTDLIKKLDKLKEEAIQLFERESVEICKKENVCLDINNPENIESSCSALKALYSKVNNENKNRQKNFNSLKNKIKSFNEEVVELNEKFNDLNSKLKGKEVDIKECNSLIEDVNRKIAEDEIVTLDIIKNKCSNLETLSESGEIKPKGFFAKIFGFFFGLIGASSDQVNEVNILEDPTSPSYINLSTEANDFINIKCKFSKKELELDYNVEEIKVVEKDIQGEKIGGPVEAGEQCCAFGQCSLCCKGEQCNKINYPIIFIHGHAPFALNSYGYSIDSLFDIQQKLANNGKYVKGGIILPTSDINSVKTGDWGRINKPLSIRASYYKGVYDENGRTTGKESGQSIDVYSQRLSQIVDMVIHHTNKDKVVIVAHSMGGLVARNYIKNGGSNKVSKLITIGTPNHGIYGWLVGGLCGVANLAANPECQDMQHDSLFIKNLNTGAEVNSNFQTLSIIGVCDTNAEGEQHDEVVRASSAKLQGAKNVIVNGPCVDGTGTFHGDLVKNDQVYSELVNFLG